MNDNSIRKILIEYLCASCDKIRIYQEKMIGSAVCDVMAVGCSQGSTKTTYQEKFPMSVLQ